jgi:hypothetical protein
MIRSAAIVLVSTAAAALASCAQQQPATPLAAGTARDCFNARNVSGFTAVDDDTVDVRVGSRRVYRLELAGVCPNVNWATGVALVSRGSSFICHGFDAELIVPNPGLGPQRCFASSVRRLTDAEVEPMRRR